MLIVVSEEEEEEPNRKRERKRHKEREAAAAEGQAAEKMAGEIWTPPDLDTGAGLGAGWVSGVEGGGGGVTYCQPELPIAGVCTSAAWSAPPSLPPAQQ